VQYIGSSAEKKEKLSENCLIEVTRLHHSIQAAFNKTIISIFERKLPQSIVTKSSRKLNLQSYYSSCAHVCSLEFKYCDDEHHVHKRSKTIASAEWADYSRLIVPADTEVLDKLGARPF